MASGLATDVQSADCRLTPAAELAALRASLVDDEAASCSTLRLSPIERRIFGMLLAQDVVAKKTIVLLLHNREASSADLKNLDVFVSRIRAKTAERGMTIETIFGVGYRLADREQWRTTLRNGADQRH